MSILPNSLELLLLRKAEMEAKAALETMQAKQALLARNKELAKEHLLVIKLMLAKHTKS